MDILEQLSSQLNDRKGNINVAAMCLKEEKLLLDISKGLNSENNKIVIDCAEVLTEVAKERPIIVSPYANLLPQILTNKNNRARWEAMHCIALITENAPGIIPQILPKIQEIITTDKSVIVRDYAIDTLGNFAKTGEDAARKAYPLLKNAVKIWDGRHAKHALNGLINVLESLNETKAEIAKIAKLNMEHPKGPARKSANKLLKIINKM